MPIKAGNGSSLLHLSDVPNFLIAKKSIGNESEQFQSYRKTLIWYMGDFGIQCYRFNGLHLPSVNESRSRREYTHLNPSKVKDLAICFRSLSWYSEFSEEVSRTELKEVKKLSRQLIRWGEVNSCQVCQ